VARGHPEPEVVGPEEKLRGERAGLLLEESLKPGHVAYQTQDSGH
jgi:hypothetical protein